MLCFRVAGEPGRRLALPSELAHDYQPPEAEALAGAPRRAIALVERELDGEPNMLTMRELAPVTDAGDGPVVSVVDGSETTGKNVVVSWKWAATAR